MWVKKIVVRIRIFFVHMKIWNPPQVFWNSLVEDDNEPYDSLKQVAVVFIRYEK